MQPTRSFLLALACSAALTGAAFAAEPDELSPDTDTSIAAPAEENPIPDVPKTPDMPPVSDPDTAENPENPDTTPSDEPDAPVPDEPTEPALPNTPAKPEPPADDPIVSKPVIPSAPDDDDKLAPNIVLTYIEAQYVDAVAIALDDETGLTAFFDNLTSSVTAYDADTYAYRLFIHHWDISAVDVHRTGMYAVTAVPELEPGFVLADGLELPTLTMQVSVQIPGELQIDSMYAARASYCFPWIMSAEQEKHVDEDNYFTLWLRKGDGAWEQQQNGFGFAGNMLMISPYLLHLEYGCTYSIQVDYPGGQTGIATFLHEKSPQLLDYAQGSRDGGGENTDLPDVIQPSPSRHHFSGASISKPEDVEILPADEPKAPDTPPETPVSEPQTEQELPVSAESDAVLSAEPDVTPLPMSDVQTITVTPKAALRAPQTIAAPAAASPAPVETASATPAVPGAQTASGAPSEQDTRLHTLLFGTRIQTLVMLGEALTVQQSGVTLHIPADALAALSLAETDTLSVQIAWTDADTLSVSVLVGDMAVTSLPGFTLSLPWSQDGPPTILTASDNAHNITLEDSMLSFSADAPGDFTFSVPSVTTPASAPLPFAAAAAAVLAVGCGSLYWFRRKRRRMQA